MRNRGNIAVMLSVRHLFAALALAASGCSFSIQGLDDLGGEDLARPIPGEDAATNDAASSEDSAVLSDGPPPLPDLTDAALPVLGAPSHVTNPGALPKATCTLSGVTSIDTMGLKVYNGGTAIGLGSGCSFTKQSASGMQGELAILVVGSWSVDQAVHVTGPRPLLVYARDQVTVDAKIDAAAEGVNSGPGGSSAGGANLGGDGGGGAHAAPYSDGGGGGAAYAKSDAAAGGIGKASSSGSDATAGGAGATYLDAAILKAGSRGGLGGSSDTCLVSSGGTRHGGGAGGAVQISAETQIVFHAGGGISAGGGGGAGGCGDVASAGGGGGSGGMIFLEAPRVVLAGTLAANGGAGGAAGTNDGSDAAGVSGTAGDNAVYGDTVAHGHGGAVQGTAVGGDGGDGAYFSTVATPGSEQTNGGGGGGGVGAILIRVHSLTRGGTVSPPEQVTKF